MPDDELLTIVERIGNAVMPSKIYLFGSFARGDAGKHSDYDIYVVMPNGSENSHDICQRAYGALLGMKRQRGTDILVADEATFDRRKDRETIEQNVAKEGILLYERGK